MDQRRPPTLPVWAFATLAVGGLVATGIYVGKLASGGNGTGDLMRAVA